MNSSKSLLVDLADRFVLPSHNVCISYRDFFKIYLHRTWTWAPYHFAHVFIGDKDNKINKKSYRSIWIIS